MTVHLLPTLLHRPGNNRNFLRLIRDTPLEETQYFALSDQDDDVWLPQKLERAVNELSRTGADAHSSNATAFWGDGRKRILVKSNRQRRFDHLLGSAGPGCTFVFRRSAFVVGESGNYACVPKPSWTLHGADDPCHDEGPARADTSPVAANKNLIRNKAKPGSSGELLPL